MWNNYKAYEMQFIFHFIWETQKNLSLNYMYLNLIPYAFLNILYQ